MRWTMPGAKSSSESGIESGAPAELPTGRLLVGTSGFAYPAWAPRFYPPGTRATGLLSYYGSRLPACELNNTFYQQPSEAKVRAWLASTPADFRFVTKAQRGGSFRAITGDAGAAVAWLTPPLRVFGDRLGSVLFRVPAEIERNDDRLATLLAAWPNDLPLTMEFQHASWRVDEVLDRLTVAGAAWCTTELDEMDDPPPLDVTGSWLYLRLRKSTYAPQQLDAWAARLSPFLAAGHDVYVFFRHDADGESAIRALTFRDLVEDRLAGEGSNVTAAAELS
jgi:uncharacterized protein YecE (DUF72 family)